jgi:hypothetical protein
MNANRTPFLDTIAAAMAFSGSRAAGNQ